MKKQVEIKGISTTSSYTDGDSHLLVNLRRKNGVLKPVTPRKVVQTLAHAYDYLFEHNLPQGGLNLIGVRNNTVYLVSETETQVTTNEADFKSISQIGNLLTMIDGSGMTYMIWSDTQYTVVKGGFGGEQTDSVLGPVKVDLKVDVDVNESGVRNLRQYYADNSYSSNQASTAKTLCHSLFSKALTSESEQGRLTGIFQACTAFELFDGTYVLHSNPVLMSIPNDIGTRYENLIIHSLYGNQGPFNYLTKPCGWDFRNLITTGEQNNTYNYYVRNVNSIMPLYGDNYEDITTDFPYLASTWIWRDKPYVSILSNKLKFKINANIDEKWSTFIKSVSIFISKEIIPIDISSKESDMKEGIIGYSWTGDDNLGGSNWFMPYKTNNDIIKELADNQQFYKVHEITFDELRSITPDTWVDIDLKGKLGENLTMQEELTVDNFSHHDLIPKGQMTYNAKLHIWNYAQTLFRPWGWKYNMPIQGVGQFQATTQSPTFASTYIVLVSIKTSTGISKTIRINDLSISDVFSIENLMISYPDSRAYKMQIGVKLNSSSGYTMYDYALTASDTHNFAYWISPTLKPMASTTTSYVSADTINEQNRTLIYKNVLKASSANNPLYFPSVQTYTVGTGFIRNVSTNALRMSDGQFGQYPLYVFTNEGVYSLDTGTELAYNAQSPASMEIPTSDIVCAIPAGVIFIGKRGVFIIGGQEAMNISKQLEQVQLPMNIQPSGMDFLSKLDTLKEMLYDARMNELILVFSDENLVLNITDSSWYNSTEAVDIEVKNANPELKVLDGMTIKDYSQAESNTVTCKLITRPMYMGMDEVKNVQRIILRGLFYGMEHNTENSCVSVYGSRDGVEMVKLRGMTIPTEKQPQNRKDCDMGMMMRATYRNYVVAVDATLDEKSEIRSIDFEVKDDINNDKQR
jgi:hypothetical protein